MENFIINLSDNKEISVEVNEKKIRRSYLRVYPSGKVAVSVPKNFGKERIEQFILKNIAWIEGKLHAQEFSVNKKLYYLGEEITLSVDNEKDKKIYFEGLKKEAYVLYRGILEELCSKYTCFKPKPSLVVRSMVSWGLYNKRKNQVTINVKLIQADIESIKLVIFHELCHTIEQNHSEKFYELLKMEYPDCKEMRKKLKKYNSRY